MRSALLVVVIALAQHTCTAVAVKPSQHIVDLMQLLNGTTNYYTQTSLSADQVEAEWAVKRHRMLAGDMTAEERELYVSNNKAPIFVAGTEKGLLLMRTAMHFAIKLANTLFISVECAPFAMMQTNSTFTYLQVARLHYGII